MMSDSVFSLLVTRQAANHFYSNKIFVKFLLIAQGFEYISVV